MVAIGEQLDAVRAANEQTTTVRFGPGRLESRPQRTETTSGLQWSGPVDDLAAIDNLIADLGLDSRNDLVTRVLKARYQVSPGDSQA